MSQRTAQLRLLEKFRKTPLFRIPLRLCAKTPGSVVPALPQQD